MRAAIACVKCRRSKTKCNNKGDNTPCETCVTNKLRCEYQDAHTTTIGTGSYTRRESTNGDVEAPPKKRKRVLASASSVSHYALEISRSQGDILDEPWLTRRVWEELFDIYEKHFATEFPFLHRGRWVRPLHQARPINSATVKTEHVSLPRPPHGPLLLLAFLTQTARHHSEIVSRTGGNPIQTAELFAEATRKRLKEMPDQASLESTQALLFLGFYEWTDLHGQKGFRTLRAAITNAQALGYQYLDEPRNEKASVANRDDEFLQQEDFIDREVERRTFWSCFIMDRYASCGKTRPPVLSVADILVQLPCSDKAFNYGQKVKTRFLFESDQKYAERRRKSRGLPDHSNGVSNKHYQDERDSDRYDAEDWEVGKDEGELSLYIQAVDHFGMVMKWSTPGGRRKEVLPPWHSESGFKLLEDNNQRLRAALPRQLMLTPRNTEVHIACKTSRNYLLIHAMHTLCTIALYREYMAFAPFILTTPKGPLDEPKIDDPLPREDYWVIQASRCFGAAREFADLLGACHQANALVDTPMAGWATYIVAWSACYCFFFPRMDPNNALDFTLQPNAWDTTNTIILEMTGRLRMANQWREFLVGLRRYYMTKRNEWRLAGGSPGSTTSDGGGLDDYSGQFEPQHKEFGSLANGPPSFAKVEEEDLKLQPDTEMDERYEASNSASYKGESQTPTFTSVNRSVNRESVEMESSSETTPLPQRNLTSHVSDPRLSDGLAHASLPSQSNYGTQAAHSVRSSAHGVSMVAPPYYQGSARHVPQTNHNVYHAPNLAPRTEPMHYAPQDWGWQQQQPQSRFNSQQMREIEAEGQHGFDMSDLMCMSAADNPIGDANYQYGIYTDMPWTQHVTEQQHAPPGTMSIPTGPYSSSYSHMNTK